MATIQDFSSNKQNQRISHGFLKTLHKSKNPTAAEIEKFTREQYYAHTGYNFPNSWGDTIFMHTGGYERGSTTQYLLGKLAEKYGGNAKDYIPPDTNLKKTTFHMEFGELDEYTIGVKAYAKWVANLLASKAGIKKTKSAQ